MLIAAILLTAILRSSWRGLFLSLSGVIVLILTIIGANLGAKALTQPVADWATPKIEEKIAVKVEKTLEDRTQEQGRTLEELLPDSLRNLLNRTGLMENLRGALERQAESTIAATARAIAAAVARELVESFAYAILYVLLFLALGAVLHVASLGISMLLRLPLLSSANTLGGALLGLLEGMIVVWLLIWLIPHFGVELPTENTYLLRFFTAVGPLSLLSSL
ncbi:MAG: CvpA family protein [Oscillibacter sp.]|nr:CvpA family protein [Oscillibacter sp.]